MKYVLVTPEFPPFLGGGISTYCKFTVEGLVTNEVEVEVVVPMWNKRNSTISKHSNFTVHELSVDEWASNAPHIQGQLKSSFAVAEYFRENDFLEKYDVVEFIDYGALGYYTLKNRQLFIQTSGKARIIISSHGPKTILDSWAGEDPYRLPGYFTGIAERWTYNAADFVFFPTHFARKQCELFLEKIERTEILVHPFRQTEMLENSSNKSEEFASIFFGRKSELKGLTTYVDALRATRIVGKHAVIGGDSWLESKKCLASNYIRKQLENSREIVLQDLGLLSQEKVLEIINRSRVVVMPSKIEWFGYAYLECAAQGVRTITTQHTGAAELSRIIRDPNCVTVSSGYKELGSAILAQLERTPPFALTKIDLSPFDPKENVAKKLHILQQVDKNTTNRFPSTQRVSKMGRIRENGKVSVVIPFFNNSSTIGETLRSVYKSSLLPEKVIVVDDGSDMEQHRYVQSLLVEYDFRFSIIRKERNAGLPAARNTGLSTVDTEYVLFLDSDDIVDEGYLQIGTEILGRYENVAGVGCWVSTFGRQVGVWETLNGESEFNIYKNTLNSASIIWSRVIIEDIGGFDESMTSGFEDWNIVCRVLDKGWEVPVIDRTLFNYRVSDNSMFSKLTKSEMSMIYERKILSLANATKRKSVERLIESNGPGYEYTYPLIPPPQDYSENTYELLRKISRRFPVIRRFWDQIPLGFRSNIVSLLIQPKSHCNLLHRLVGKI